jgi:hypothetical protein
VAGDVNAYVAHGADGEGVDPRGLGAGAVGMEAVTAEVAEPALGHLAAGGIVRADKEHASLLPGQICHLRQK